MFSISSTGTTNQPLVVICLLLFGWLVVSFVNVVVQRQSWSKALTGRSRCDKCHALLRWWQLIPIVSYIMLGGKCAHCHKAISRWHFWAELGFLLLWSVVIWRWRYDLPQVYPQLILLLVMYYFSLYDLWWRVIPKIDMYVVLVIGLASQLWLDWQTALIRSGILLLLLLLTIGITSAIVKKSAREVFGNGDILYMLMLALFFPPQIYLYMILGAAVVGLIAAKLFFRKPQLPFIPFLSLAVYTGMVIWQYSIM